MAKKVAAQQPGDVLRDLLDEYQITPTQLAEDIQMSVSAIRQIVTNKAKISLHIAKRFSKYFGTTVQYWVDLQNTIDLIRIENDQELAEIVKQIPKAKKPSIKTVAGKPAAKRNTGKPAVVEKITEKPSRKSRSKKAEPQEGDTSDWEDE